MFYINYVICKFSKSDSNTFWFLCFILTMWYVNPIQLEARITKFESFILTMWYVNHSHWEIVRISDGVLY